MNSIVEGRSSTFLDPTDTIIEIEIDYGTTVRTSVMYGPEEQ